MTENYCSIGLKILALNGSVTLTSDGLIKRIAMMTSQLIGQFTVLHPQGRFDSQRGKEIAMQIGAISPQTPVLCLNFAGIDFIDSAGLGQLVHGLKTSRQNSCRLILCNLPGQVKLILEIAKLEGVFEIYDSYEQVLEALHPENTVSLSRLSAA